MKDQLRNMLSQSWYGTNYNEVGIKQQKKMNKFLADNNEFIKALFEPKMSKVYNEDVIFVCKKHTRVNCGECFEVLPKIAKPPEEKKECEHEWENTVCKKCGIRFLDLYTQKPIEELIKREKEIIEMLQILCVSPYPLLPESLHWCWYEAINYFKKELLKRISELIRAWNERVTK